MAEDEKRELESQADDYSKMLLALSVLPPKVREVIYVMRREGVSLREAYRRVYGGGDAAYNRFRRRWRQYIDNIIQGVRAENVMLNEAKNVNWDWILAYCYSQVKSAELDDKERVKILEIMVKALEKKEKSSSSQSSLEDEI